MGMNNADFLSDAVALDLGKSGVKVAETLEIQVGEEWWRLINAADVSTVRAYQGRRVNEGAISGGEMDLSGFTRAGLQMRGDWDTSTLPLGRAHVCMNGETPLYYSVAYHHATKYGYFRVWSDTQELVNQQISNTTSQAPENDLEGSYFDSVNNRIVSGYGNRGCYYSLSTGTAAIFYSVAAKSSDLWTIETFPEAPGTIYSFFLSSGGGAKVKITTPTAGQNVTTQYNAVISNSGATALTAITNFSLAHGLHPFYLRSAESVAVAWVDATSGQIGYVLESEYWATPRYFPAISGMLGDSIAGMGSLYLPLDGEFLLVGRTGYSTGNVTREPGYTFPANWTLLGAYPNGEDTMRLFGIVGTTVYGYDLTLSTMCLTYLGVATTAWAWGIYPECTKIGESGDLDLLVFAEAAHLPSGDIPGNGVAVYNRVANSFVYQWKNFESSSLFPNSYSESVGGAVFRFDSQLLVLKNKYTKNMVYIDSYVINAADVLACSAASEVDALLVAAGRQTATVPKVRSYAGLLPAGANGSLTAIYHDSEFFYLLMHEDRWRSVAPWIHRYRISKANRSDGTTSIYLGGGNYTGTANYRCVRFSTQQKENAFYYQNKVQDSVDFDNLFRLSFEYAKGEWYLGFWSQGTPTPTQLIKVGRSSTYTALAQTILNPAVGLRGEMASYTTYSTYLRLFGAAWDLNTRLGGNTIVRTAPFAPNKSFQDEANDAAVYFGAVSGGELPYIKHSAIEGLLTGIHAIKISDGTVYTVNLGHTCAGGLAAFSPCGSWLVYRSGSGVFRMMPTGATLTDGMGEGGAGGGSAVGLYVYDYLDRQFLPYPFAREGIRAELSNISKTTKITLPETQDNLIRGMLAAGTDFRGSRCILRRVFPDHLDEVGSDIVLLDGYIQDWSYVPGKKGIAFSVSKTLIDVGAQFPKRLMNMGCSHVFKGSRCRYLGEEGRCLKTRAYCTSLGNLNQFGGFPWVAARQRRVMWK
jgi:hypothetical protein